jgi:hypothetical protein
MSEIMRWRFIDPHNQSEVAERNSTISAIDSWWREFRSRAGDLGALFSGTARWDVPEWMAQHLGGIHPELMWEFGPGVQRTGHRLVITPESSHHLRPLVSAILARAPAIEGWEFYAHRLAESLEMAQQSVEGRTNRNLDDLGFRASIGEHQRVDLNFTSFRATGKESSLFEAAFIAVEMLLGEECLNNWVGVIDVDRAGPTKRLTSLFKKSKRLPIDRLHDTVHALIASMREQLPARPHHEWVRDAPWTLWELEPKPASECGQEDLFVARSGNPVQWTAAHSGGIFCSERFSRCGETFCYLKMDGSEGLPGGGVADKAEIEDALDAALAPKELGCHVGSGSGRRYAYIDLALTDLDRGIDVAKECLKEGRVPQRSWIQFHDSALAAEWVGIYEDTPPPPLPDFSSQRGQK